MSESVVVTELRNRSLWIRLNRPDAMNSLTPEVLQAIDKGLDQALESTDVMTVVLTGTGRAFSAGADLKYVRGQLGETGTSTFLAGVLRTMNRLDRFPKPVIASALPSRGGWSWCCAAIWLLLPKAQRLAMHMPITACFLEVVARCVSPA